MSKTNTLTIYTPEGIAFSLFIAGPVTRFLAWVIDLACIAIAAEIIGTLVGLLGIISLDFTSAVTMVCYFIVSIGYGIVLEWFWHGQTLGKRLLRLRVMDVQGLRLQLSQIVIRNLLRFVDSLPLFYLVGGVVCLVSPKAQRLGDLAANTLVIRNPKIPEPDLEQLLAGKIQLLSRLSPPGSSFTTTGLSPGIGHCTSGSAETRRTGSGSTNRTIPRHRPSFKIYRRVPSRSHRRHPRRTVCSKRSGCRLPIPGSEIDIWYS